MAAPTSVRAEAQSMSSIILRFTYAGSHWLGIYRSTDGVSYSEVDQIASTETDYEDTGLDSGTRYYYKITDDDGSTFSTAVDTYTHFCADQNAGQAFQLPRFDEGQEEQSAKLNDLAERVERALGDMTIAPETCVVCPDTGSVTIDCTDGCNKFLVIADQDIDSFTINRCGPEGPEIEIFVPPGETVGICGFPAGYGFGGDECTEAPISGGTDGRTMSVGGAGGRSSRPGPPKSTQGARSGSGGGVGGSNCECIPGRNNQLTLKCCTASCSLSCGATVKQLLVKVCGGVGPYTFSKTGSVAFKTTPAGGTSTTVTTKAKEASPQVVVVPPTNSGSAEAGDAYGICYYGCSNCACAARNTQGEMIFGCDDSNTGCTTTPGAECTGIAPASAACVQNDSSCTKPKCDNGSLGGAPCTAPVGNTESNAVDKRSAGMISAGCNPCGLQAGSVITVTDASGVSTSITLKR